MQREQVREYLTLLLGRIADVYGEIKVLQAIWSDSSGRLPWERSYRNAADAQPLLGPVPESFK